MKERAHARHATRVELLKAMAYFAYSAMLTAVRKCALFTDPSPTLTKLSEFLFFLDSMPRYCASPAPIARPICNRAKRVHSVRKGS